MKFRIHLMAALVAICAVAGFGLSPSSASASEVGALGCQSKAAHLVYRYHLPDTGVGTLVKRCSGNFAVDSSGVVLEAGAWSGWFTANGVRTPFCSYDVWFFNGAHITRIEMSPTNVSGCP
jgi:hypothetical protein